MDQRPPQPPEGRLIAAAADRLDLSIREAARRAGISYGRWRQIVMGYQNVSPGVYAPVRAPARTVARMAAVVGVTADQMEAEGKRPDVAAILRETPAAPQPVSPVLALQRGPDDVVPSMDPAFRAEADPHLLKIAVLVLNARDDHWELPLSVPLEGAWVFPGDPVWADQWDRLVRRGKELTPRGWSDRQLAEMMASIWVLTGEPVQARAARR